MAMKLNFHRLLSYWTKILTSLAVILTVVGIELLPLPTFAKPKPEEIAQVITTLKASEDCWIEINLSTQRLIAWEGQKPVYAVIVSTGKKLTPTLPGVFEIKTKHRLNRMRGAGYDVADVPYAMYYDGGYAIHGAYWHNRFGTPVSHGCINLAVDHAQWLFNWAKVGTTVVIHP